MPRIIRNTLLNYIPPDFKIKNTINKARIFEVNNTPIRAGCIVYICEREVRAKDNFALQFAIQKSKELNLSLKIIHPKENYEYKTKQKFIDNQIEQTLNLFNALDIDFKVINKTPFEIIQRIS